MSTVTADPREAAPGRDPRPAPGLWATVKKLLKPVASLQLTVGLLAASVGLVFLGTLAQKTQGIWAVVDQYFWSWVVFVDVQPSLEFAKIFFGVSADVKAPSWASVPFPGGKLIGGLMFVNLLAAHLVRMKLSWKRAGVITLHSGLLLLFVGEFITREFQVEQQMNIVEGGGATFAFDHRHAELALVDSSDPAADKMTVVSDRLLKKYASQDTAFDSPELPVSVQVVEWFDNSALVDAKPGMPNLASAGTGLNLIAEKRREAAGVSQDEGVDQPSAYVALYKKGTPDRIGTFMVSVQTERPQPVEIDGKTYNLSLRFTEYHKPFRLELDKLHVDYYPGSQIPKNYASDLRLIDPEAGQNRPVTVAMNEPLRYRGETFYQSKVMADPRTGQPMTVLQVVRNPGWLLPYAACILVTLGMALHFGLNLGTFLGKAKARVPAKAPVGIAVGAVVIAGLYVLSTMRPKSVGEGEFDFVAVGKLPVLDGGRVKPLDTVARKDLRLITHGEQFDLPQADGSTKKLTAVRWFMDVASGTPDDPGTAAKYPIFRIENDQLWDLLKVKRREGLRYSIDEIKERFEALDSAAREIENRAERDRTAFDGAVLELRRHLKIYLDAWQAMGPTAPAVLPPAAGLPWRKPGDVRRATMEVARSAALEWARENGLPLELDKLNAEQKEGLLNAFESARDRAEARDPGFLAWNAMMAAYRDGRPAEFNKKVAAFAALSAETVPAGDQTRAKFETFLNNFAPFYRCAFLYGFAAVLTLAGWAALAFSAEAAAGLRRAAFWVLLLTFAVHTFGLFSRMYLMDRPMVFVTNLYSSAVFIGWAAAGICLIVERLVPLGLGNAVAAGLGIVTNIIAHNLALGGDTLEMMQAVLDTNFWLATHVTTVTLGYSATYVAAAVGLGYVLLGVFTPFLRRPAGTGTGDLGRTLAQVTYGIVCVATLFSFVGTVLGGIWADQSWGRFWGWDPKENGAVLIVTWNALILHARWCGLVKDRGVAVLAVAGAIITTWSWFGTNQLGVGLHAYGFSNELVRVCVVTWAVSAGIALLGLTPTRFWRSFATPA